METLDKCFENVCELDLIFHMDKVCSIFQKKINRVYGCIRLTVFRNSYMEYKLGILCFYLKELSNIC